jgi:hypothetical protein
MFMGQSNFCCVNINMSIIYYYDKEQEIIISGNGPTTKLVVNMLCVRCVHNPVNSGRITSIVVIFSLCVRTAR